MQEMWQIGVAIACLRFVCVHAKAPRGILAVLLLRCLRMGLARLTVGAEWCFYSNRVL